MQSLWNQQYFAASPKPFAQKPWNFCEMVFVEIRAENRCQHTDGRVSERKWEPFYLDINHQSRVIQEQRWMEVEARNSMSLCHIYFPIVVGAIHTSFKMFSQYELMCSVASDYHEKKNKVKDFLAQNFRLDCLGDFKKLRRIWSASSKTIEEFIF